MNEARGHHFISQFYLRGFTSNGAKKSKLFVVDLKRRRTFETTPANVACIRDFNRVEGRPAGEIEALLSTFESYAGRAIKIISEQRSLEDRQAWSNIVELMALYAVRHPAQRESVRRSMAQVAKVTMDMVTATPELYEAHTLRAREAGYLPEGQDVTRESMRDFLERGEYQITVATSRHLQLEFGVIETVYHLLAERKWDLLIAADGEGAFVSCDRPLALFHSDGGAASLHRPLGHAVRQTTVYFPLSRSMAVIGTFERGGDVQQIGPHEVELLNRNAVAHATEQIYAPSPRARVQMGSGSIFVADLLAHVQVREQQDPLR